MWAKGLIGVFGSFRGQKGGAATPVRLAAVPAKGVSTLRDTTLRDRPFNARPFNATTAPGALGVVSAFRLIRILTAVLI